MIKAVIIAVLAFMYYWTKQKKALESKESKHLSYLQLYEKKDDEVVMSGVAMILILVAMPELLILITNWFPTLKETGIELIRIIIGFVSGMLGTFVVDKITGFSKKKIDENLK